MIPISPLALKADATSPQSFTIDFPGGVSANNTFTSSSLNQFNPALGTLTGFQVTLTGSTTWTATTAKDSLQFILFDTNASQLFIQSDTGSYPINISLSGNDYASKVLPYWTGTGINLFNLNSLAGGFSDTLSAATLNGTLVYDYTPVATPEPSSLLLLGTGLLGLAPCVATKSGRNIASRYKRGPRV